MSTKAKISVSISKRLLDELDRRVSDRGRSEVIEAALEWWLRSKKKAGIDAEVERYYRSLTSAEEIEDRAWAETGDAMVAEPREPYRRRTR